ncbi:MAG: M1 family metallopeptidase [Acidimicrobiia bacterium]|nr:M1 family metallopeptidase [Acidimicrobiia bacterium]
MSSEADHRLPRSVIPSHYVLEIEPNFETFAFKGRVVITAAATERVAEIVLNSIEIDIDAVEVVAADGSSQNAGLSYEDGRERVTLVLGTPVEPGPVEIRLDYTGTINDNLQGFYRSTYTTASGEEKVIATTQFEATDARRAFPCWDEPDMKATYQVTLVVPDHMMAISNAQVVSDEPAGPGQRRVEFATTMKMSTYLVAFIVGELEATDPVDVDGTPLRIVHTPGKAHLAQFALDAGAFALRYFADYYGIPYPGDKLDMIAVPDFAWGAMENLGAVTYRETALLVDPDKATQGEQARVADVIAHELAHMWFGDLVTMKWWNGIWLNEAFATFMELKCVDAYRPDWKRWLSFAAGRNAAMDTDSLASTRPIEFPVGSPEEANEMFDILTYSKGSSVLRMLEVYLGEDTFRDGIRRYLKAHSYANTETADLWSALEEVSGEPVGEMMHGWIFQGGYPRVSVSRDGDNIVLSQEHFRFLGEGRDKWHIPALYAADEDEGRVLIGDESSVSGLDGFRLNRGGQGFYRVQYEGELRDQIAHQAADLPAEERYALVSDLWANVLAGDVPAGDFLELASQFKEESEPEVWGAIIGGLGELNRVVSSDDRPAFQDFVRNLVSDAADKMGWQPGANESDLDRRLRGLLLRTRGVLGNDKTLLPDAAAVFAASRNGDEVDGEVAAAAVAIVAANGSEEEFDTFIDAYRNAASPQDEVRFLQAAITVPEQETAAKVLEMLTAGDIRRQDGAWVTARLIGHRTTGAESWNRIKDSWDAVLAAVPPQSQRRILDWLPARSEPEVAADIEAWLTDHPLSGGSKYVDQQLELLKVRVGLRAREEGRLGDSL